MKLTQIATVTGGQLIGSDQEIERFIIDGRIEDDNGSASKTCYVAILGERLNGHQFVTQASQQGVAAALVSEPGNYPISVVVVDDTIQALADLAKWHRAQFQAPVFALTGSCGKTTVKEMVRLILPTTAFVTPGNKNNHIGAPLSVLSLNHTHSHAVFELGANHRGEIGMLSDIVKPDLSLITIIAPAHLEGFGTIEGVADTKGEIFASLDPKDGMALVNLDDHRVVAQAKRHQGRTLTYSMKSQLADVSAKILHCDEHGEYLWQLNHQSKSVEIQMAVPGKHNVANGLAAAATAIAMGRSLIDIKAGLEQFGGVQGRLALKEGSQGSRLIDDTYNANLRSVKAAIDVLAQSAGQKIFVLGELGEVGEALNDHYEQIGLYARQKKIDNFFTCGKASQKASDVFASGGSHFSEKQALIEAIRPILAQHVTVLVKGSRSAQMEQVIKGLMG